MKTILSILAVALITGCNEVTPHYNRTQVAIIGTPASARPVNTVALYQSPAEVPGPYERVAIFSVEGHAGDEAQFMQAFLYHAAAIGADGVIFSRVSLVSTREGGVTVVGQSGGFNVPSDPIHEAVYHGEAIRFTSPNPASPLAQPTRTPANP